MNKIIRGAIDCSLPKYYIEELKHIPTNGVLWYGTINSSSNKKYSIQIRSSDNRRW